MVQTTGGFPNPHGYNPITILQSFVNRFDIRGTFFNLPVYAPSGYAFASMAEHFLNGTVRTMWDSCTVTVTGVGGCDEDSIYRIEELITKSELSVLQASGAVGAIYARWFDIDGHFLDTDLNSRVFGISMDAVRRISRRILVSHGAEKTHAIIGALRTRAFNIFITTDVTARALLADVKETSLS